MDEVKGIIVVGNGTFTENQGHLINMFDTVIRLSSFKVHGYEAMVGTKTDIVSVGRIENLDVKPKIIWVCNKSGMFDVPMEIILDHYGRPVFIDEADFLNTYVELGYDKAQSHPTLGFTTIFLAVKMAKFMYNAPVTITGFDFGQVGVRAHYWEDIIQDKETEKGTHDNPNERKVIKRMISDGRVKLLNPRDIMLLSDKIRPGYGMSNGSGV